MGASRIRAVFSEAKKCGRAVIFIDEIDAVGQVRTVGPRTNNERETTLNALLVELDGFTDREGVILVAATNRPDMLDPALLRPSRIDKRSRGRRWKRQVKTSALQAPYRRNFGSGSIIGR